MNDHESTIHQLMELVLQFARERNWEQFHHPKDLALALACEVGEVLELFRFQTDPQIQAALDQPNRREELAHELADCLWILLRLANVCQIDLASALKAKVELAGQKYPIDQSFGRSDKYTAYKSG